MILYTPMCAVFRHLQFMGYLNAIDRFDFDEHKVRLFLNNFNGTFEAYKNGEFTIRDFLNYCNANGCMVYNWLKSVPTSHKIKLVSGTKSRNIKKMIEEIESSMVMYIMVADLVLKEICEMELKEVLKFNNEMREYIDSYVKAYLNDDAICEVFNDELDIDLKNMVVRFDER